MSQLPNVPMSQKFNEPIAQCANEPNPLSIWHIGSLVHWLIERSVWHIGY
jgi:hypothetical protein